MTAWSSARGPSAAEGPFAVREARQPRADRGSSSENLLHHHCARYGGCRAALDLKGAGARPIRHLEPELSRVGSEDELRVPRELAVPRIPSRGSTRPGM